VDGARLSCLAAGRRAVGVESAGRSRPKAFFYFDRRSPEQSIQRSAITETPKRELQSGPARAAPRQT
jgi:hypothetical protein